MEANQAARPHRLVHAGRVVLGRVQVSAAARRWALLADSDDHAENVCRVTWRHLAQLCRPREERQVLACRAAPRRSASGLAIRGRAGADADHLDLRRTSWGFEGRSGAGAGGDGSRRVAMGADRCCHAGAARGATGRRAEPHVAGSVRTAVVAVVAIHRVDASAVACALTWSPIAAAERGGGAVGRAHGALPRHLDGAERSARVAWTQHGAFC